MSLRIGSEKRVSKGPCRLMTMISRSDLGGGVDAVRFGNRHELITAKRARGENLSQARFNRDFYFNR